MPLTKIEKPLVSQAVEACIEALKNSASPELKVNFRSAIPPKILAQSKEWKTFLAAQGLKVLSLGQSAVRLTKASTA